MVAFQKMTSGKFLFWMFGIFFLLLVSSGIFAALGVPMNGTFMLQVFFYGLLFVVFYFGGLEKEERGLLFTKKKLSPGKLMIFVPFFIGGIINILYTLFLERFSPGLHQSYLEASDLMDQIIGEVDVLGTSLLFLSVVILAPIVEEILFRGIFFNVLGKKHSTLFAMMMSSIVFGVLHLETMVPTFIIGLVICFIYQQTGSLLLAILAHFFNNLMAFVMPYVLVGRSPEDPLVLVMGSVLVVAFLFFTIYFIRYVLKNRETLKEEPPMHRVLLDAVKAENGSPFYDISKPLYSGMPVYEGDPEVLIEPVATVNKDGYALSALFFGSHSGTHMDFPSHFIEEGKSMEDFPLEKFYGEALVVDAFWESIPSGEKKVLARSGYLTLNRAKALVENGVELIGTVHESIEEEPPYEVHKFLLNHDIIILENLHMDHVKRGSYTLCAFPLSIKGAEGAPVRAVLMDDLPRNP